MVTYKVLDTNFDQACNGLEIYHNVALDENDIVVRQSNVHIAKDVSVQIGYAVGDKVIKWSKDLIKEVLTGR